MDCASGHSSADKKKAPVTGEGRGFLGSITGEPSDNRGEVIATLI